MKKRGMTDSAVWRDRYDIGVKNQEQMFRKFADWYDLMYAHINTSNYALWRSKVFIPIIPSKAWAMVAKMASLKPGFEVGLYGENLNNDEYQQRAEKAQWKLEHDWDNPMFDESMGDKLFSPLVDAVVTGTGVAKIPWTLVNNTRFEKYQDEGTGEVDVTQDVKIEETAGYNDLIPHDILATYVTPGAKNLYSAGWVILEDYVTLDMLESENEAAGFEVNKNLDDVRNLKSEPDQFAKEKQSRTALTNDEEDADTTTNQIKRLECYEKKHGQIYRYVYAVGKGGKDDKTFVELACGPLPYWHRKYPLVTFYVKKRPHNFWGQGVFEDTERMQSAFNDWFNHYMDNANLALDGMIAKQDNDEHNYIVEPGGEYLYRDKPPVQFKFPTPDSSMFNNVVQFLESQVEEATISRYATGTPNSATDKTAGTASGISKLTEMAGDKIGFMKQSFSNSVREIGRQWLSNNQQFLDSDFTLMGQVDNKPAPVTIKPADLQGQMMLRINDASMEPISKEEELIRYNAYIMQLQQLQTASIGQAQVSGGSITPMFIDFSALARNLSHKAGQADFDKIIISEDEIPPAQEPPKEEKPQTFALPDLYGSEASQLLAKEGIQPDPARMEQVPQQVTDMAMAREQALLGAMSKNGPEEKSGQTKKAGAGRSATAVK